MFIDFKVFWPTSRLAIMAALIMIGACSSPRTHQVMSQSDSQQILNSDRNQLVFPTPEAALDALLLAFKEKNEKTLLDVFGHEHEKLIVVTDKIARDEALEQLYEAAQDKKTIIHDGEDRRTIIIGNKAWPFPIPLVKVESGWLFDTAQGAEEIINRRIGANELGAIDTIHAYVEAQEEYASNDRDNDLVLEYAQRFRSTEGSQDGLYWYVEPNGDEDLSPLGPLLADAAAYLAKAKKSDKVHIPFHGYYYKILSKQGGNPPGGEYEYIINGNMIAGFALVACPADYGSSGVMTFLVSHQGKIFEKDLGEKTHSITNAMMQYNPDNTWKLADDQQ